MLSLQSLALRESAANLDLEETLIFLGQQTWKLDDQTVRDILESKLKCFDPLILEKRNDLQDAQALIAHGRDLLRGNSTKFGLSSKRGDWLLPYYSFGFDNFTNPMEVVVDGSRPCPGVSVLFIEVEADPAPVCFFYTDNWQPKIRAIRDQIARVMSRKIIEKWDAQGSDSIEITVSIGNLVEKIDEPDPCDEDGLFRRALNILTWDHIQHELDARIVDDEFDSLCISCGNLDWAAEWVIDFYGSTVK